MGSYLNPGSKGFQESLNSEIYVDKTGLIEKTNAVLNTRQKFIWYFSQRTATSCSVKPKYSASSPGSVMEYSVNIFSAEWEPYFLMGKMPVM